MWLFTANRIIMSETDKDEVKFMIAKIVIGIGILMIVLVVAPIAWQIYRMTHETSGIGAIGGNLILLFFPLVVGSILIFVGVVKLYKNSKTLK